MKKLLLVAGCLLLVAGYFVFQHLHTQETVKVGWPAVQKEMRPWTRWWWMGNSVNPSDLTAAMESYSKVGLGGLEITAIYGVHGYENKFIKFLSPEWLDNFKYTLQEGKRLDLGIDLAMASSWPFGGLWVTPEDACKYMSVQSYVLKEGEQLQDKIALVQTPILRTIWPQNLNISQLKYPISANADSLQNWCITQVRYPIPMPLQTLMAYSDKREILNLTAKVDSDGKLNWITPSGKWKLYAVFEGWHGKMVERASLGGEGDVIDHFSAKAIDNYMGYFTNAFKGLDLSGLRAYFNDSYEVDDGGEANFTPLMFDEFQKRRGYDLRNYLPALIGEDTDENNCRVLFDYRETMSDLLLENYTKRWHNWAVNGGKIIRNQAHGAPANILDLYAAADIPETEGEDIVTLKIASSVAHVTGKNLTSCESKSMQVDHFEGSLAIMKQYIDLVLLSGVNHVFYHGTCFSPQNAPWPGWLWYSPIEFTPFNTIWKDFGTLNTYITRLQSFLQAGKPDNDILLYYPISDEYAIRGRSLLVHFGIRSKGSSIFKTAENLVGKGYAVDYISDRQILDLKNKSGQILTGGTSYQTVLLPPVKLIPLETFERIIELAKSGVTVLMEQLPEDIPGLGKLTERRAKFEELKNTLKFEPASENIQKAKVGKGQILLGSLSDLMVHAKIRRESMYDSGLQCIRRINSNTTTYFIANRGTETVDGMVTVESKIDSAVLYNPMNGEFGKALSKTSGANGKVYLQLNPGESCLIQIFSGKVNVPEYTYLKASGEKITLNADWTLTFVSGGPELPQPAKLLKLGSWTELEGDSYKAFSGTAMYKTTFTKPSGEAKFYRLDLGKVAHSARVSLNGKELVTLIGPIFSVNISSVDLKEQNTLEISVTNLMGNRVADMERKGQQYKVFYNNNFLARKAVNRGADGLFTTSNWQPQESGLIGPVTLEAAEQITKAEK